MAERPGDRFRELELSYIVSLYFDRDDLQPFDNVLSHYASFSPGLLKKIQFVFVDDCSPVEIQIPAGLRINYQLFRITEDIPWNQPGARNLGVVHARTSKIIVTDADHIFPERLLRAVVQAREPRVFYKFPRTKDGRSVRPHPNTFFCSKSLYFRSLGVDEEFSGHYGCDDIFFVALQKRLGSRFRYFNRRDVIAVREGKDGSDTHHRLVRNTGANQALWERKRAALASDRPWAAHSRLFLNFSWVKTAELMADF